MKSPVTKRPRGRTKSPSIDSVAVFAQGVGLLLLILAGIDLIVGPPSLPAAQPVARLEQVCFDRRMTYGEIADLYGMEEDLMETTLRANSPDGASVGRSDPIPGERCVLLALSPGATGPVNP
mgnify:CR=1 FL=1